MSVLRQAQAKLAFLAVQSESTSSMTVLNSESYCTCYISYIEYSELDVKQDFFYSTWTNLIGATILIWNSFCIVKQNMTFQYWYKFRLSYLVWLSNPNPPLQWLCWQVNHTARAIFHLLNILNWRWTGCDLLTKSWFFKWLTHTQSSIAF